MPAFTSLTQTACAQFFSFVQVSELLGGERILRQGRRARNRQIVAECRRRTLALKRLDHFQEPLAREIQLSARLRDHCADPDTLCRRCRVPGLACQLEETCNMLTGTREIAAHQGSARTPPQDAQQLPGLSEILTDFKQSRVVLFDFRSRIAMGRI